MARSSVRFGPGHPGRFTWSRVMVTQPAGPTVAEIARIVHLVFYSVDRNAAWPGDDETVVLDNRAARSFAIQCNRGERICFGAWVRGRGKRHWGVGRHAKYGCELCSYTCEGGEARVEVLEP